MNFVNVTANQNQSYFLKELQRSLIFPQRIVQYQVFSDCHVNKLCQQQNKTGEKYAYMFFFKWKQHREQRRKHITDDNQEVINTKLKMYQKPQSATEAVPLKDSFTDLVNPNSPVDRTMGMDSRFDPIN